MRLEHLTWVKAQDYFEKSDLVVIPLGSIESHGKHLPLGTDFLIPMKLASLLEEKTDVLITPALPFGNCDYLSDFPGTVSIGFDTLVAVLEGITAQLFHHGARRFVFLNGHGGNSAPIDKVSLGLRRKGALAARFDWWVIAGQLNPLWKGGHGGAEETAGVMAIDCALVDREQIEDSFLKGLSESLPSGGLQSVCFEGVSIPVSRPVMEATQNGWAGPDHPDTATRQMGEEMLEATADYLARFLAEFSAAPL